MGYALACGWGALGGGERQANSADRWKAEEAGRGKAEHNSKGTGIKKTNQQRQQRGQEPTNGGDDERKRERGSVSPEIVDSVHTRPQGAAAASVTQGWWGRVRGAKGRKGRGKETREDKDNRRRKAVESNTDTSRSAALTLPSWLQLPSSTEQTKQKFKQRRKGTW